MRTNTTLKTKAMSILLVLAMCLGMLPLSVFAADDTTTANKTVMLGASHIEGAQASNVYFGTYQQSSNDNGGYNIDPIKWRVLSNADGKLFLLSDQNLDVFEYHKEYEVVTWETSTMRSWLNGLANNKGNGGNAIDYTNDNFLDTAFSASEQTAIADTTVVNNDNPSYGTDGGNNTTDKVFLLSIEEAQNTAYGFTDNTYSTDTRKATNTAYVADGGKIGTSGMYGVGEAGYWWLRSPGGNTSVAAYVNDYGYVYVYGSIVDDYANAVRPAFNINRSSVLFTSAADNSGHIQFGAPAAYSGSDWKVTVKDSNSFAEGASVDKTTLAAGEALTITHKALSAISNDYTNVTAVLSDASGNLLYYGSVNADTSSTSSTVTIPAGLTDGTYTLSVYGEDWNGSNMTDYATGTPLSISVTVVSPGLIITGGVAGTDYTYENGVLDIKAAGTYEIKNVDPATATGDIIKISAPSGTVNITLGGVNIVTTVGMSAPAFEIIGDCTTNITLADGTENVLNSWESKDGNFRYYAGLQNGEKHLSISCEHSEVEGHICGDTCGSLEAVGGNFATCIGGGYGMNGSNITINGGNITANSQGHAGIGGGYGMNGTNITIAGGNIVASSANSAGIGGGLEGNGSDIAISGGTVTATSKKGAGIGGGLEGNGSNITISGGTVTATSENGAGIGGGLGGNGSNIIISGGTVTATSINGAGIGGVRGEQYDVNGEFIGSIGGSAENIKIAPAANTEIEVNTGANVSEAEELTYAFAKETDITELVSGNAYFHSETTEHNHADTNKDHVCDNDCAEFIGTCEDTDSDHACDYGCDKVYGTHEDTDTDHVCDYGCAESIGTHADSATDTDHLCDYGCGATLENCTDAVNDDNHSCDVCGKADVSEHTYGDATCEAPATCSECGATTGDALGHKDENTDHTCDRDCGKTDMGTHGDTDTDHACDYGCSVTLGTCEDADKDHDCDYGCDTVYGTHEDTDTDHACDYGCSVTIGTCEDSDKDHDCDYGCDTVYGTHEDTDTDHACDYGCSVTLGTCEDADKDHDCDYGCDKTLGAHEAASGTHGCEYCGETMTTCNDFDDIVKPEAKKSDADCTNPEEYYKSCTVCGSLGTETFTHGEAKGHGFENDKCTDCGYVDPASVEAIGFELEKFDENRVTIFWEEDIEALIAKIDALLAEENIGEAELVKLLEYKAHAEKLIEIIHDPVEYFSMRFFYFFFDCLNWKMGGLTEILNRFFYLFSC